MPALDIKIDSMKLNPGLQKTTLKPQLFQERLSKFCLINAQKNKL